MNLEIIITLREKSVTTKTNTAIYPNMWNLKKITKSRKDVIIAQEKWYKGV